MSNQSKMIIQTSKCTSLKLIVWSAGFQLPTSKWGYQLLARKPLGYSRRELDGVQVTSKNKEYSLDSDVLFCNIFRDNKTVSRALTVLKEPSPGVRPSCQINQLTLVMQYQATYLHLKSFMRLAHLCSQCMWPNSGALSHDGIWNVTTS